MNNVLTKTETTTTKCLTDFQHLIEELKRKTKDLQNVQTSEMNQFEPENERRKKQIDQNVTLNETSKMVLYFVVSPICILFCCLL